MFALTWGDVMLPKGAGKWIRLTIRGSERFLGKGAFEKVNLK
jgi:hypothetical protein